MSAGKENRTTKGREKREWRWTSERGEYCQLIGGMHRGAYSTVRHGTVLYVSGTVSGTIYSLTLFYSTLGTYTVQLYYYAYIRSYQGRNNKMKNILLNILLLTLFPGQQSHEKCSGRAPAERFSPDPGGGAI